MNKANLFKALQRKLKFRNPNNILKIGEQTFFSQAEIASANEYIQLLEQKGYSYTYPGDINYPESFYKMIEPPLFLEYIGTPSWLNHQMLSVVGARKIHPLTEHWISVELTEFLLQKENIILVSGGANGVDQAAHWVSVKSEKPTIVVLPCGLEQLFPTNLKILQNYVIKFGGCFVSEFEFTQPVRKSFFYYRNRLIAAFSRMCFVAQAERKSGTFLTVHHALQNGKTVLTLPAHPMMTEFSGNHHLMKEGAFYIHTNKDLLDFWDAECWSGRVEDQGIDCM